MRRLVAGIDPRAWLVGAALLLDLIALRTLIVEAISGAVCLERAKFELILCSLPPPEWFILLSAAVALALSIGLGALLASRRGRTARP